MQINNDSVFRSMLEELEMKMYLFLVILDVHSWISVYFYHMALNRNYTFLWKTNEWLSVLIIKGFKVGWSLGHEITGMVD